MESKPVERYHVHDYLRSKLCALYENDSIFDKFECCWSGDDRHILTGSYNNYFRTFRRNTAIESTYEASLELCKPPASTTMMAAVKNPILRTSAAAAASKKASAATPGRRRREDISADLLDFNRKILHSTWHPTANIIALAATNNLYIFEGYS